MDTLKYYEINWKIMKSNKKVYCYNSIISDEKEARAFYEKKIAGSNIIDAYLYEKVRDFSDKRYATGKVTVTLLARFI